MYLRLARYLGGGGRHDWKPIPPPPSRDIHAGQDDETYTAALFVVVNVCVYIAVMNAHIVQQIMNRTTHNITSTAD